MSCPASLTLENVRCFAGPETGQIRRITLLVGENGAGKSTFLGCYRAFSRLSSFSILDDLNYFDDPPFPMGSFPTIARREAGAFTVEGGFRDGCHASVRLEYSAGPRPYPEERLISIGLPGESRPFRVAWVGGDPDRWRMEGRGFRFDLDQADISYRQFSTWLSRAVRFGHLPFRGDPVFLGKWKPGATDEERANLARMANFLFHLPMPRDSVEVVPLDPRIPERKRRFAGLPYPVNEPDLAAQVGDIGTQMGLFSGIKASRRRLDGTREVLVETPDGWRNLVDVGYGVHAVLSLLFEICRRPTNAEFLLQEPELHIHPTAQAELATVMAKRTQHFLIETHGDHLVDRFRISVMRGDLAPDDLRILYFEKDDGGTRSTIHTISVEANGNLVGEPPGYRAFFLDETERLLGFRD